MPYLSDSWIKKESVSPHQGETLLVINGGGLQVAGVAVGAMKVLHEYWKKEGITIDRVVGVSGGSVPAALYALGMGYAKTSKFFLHYWNKNIFNDINPFFVNGFFRGDKIEESIGESLQWAQFSDTHIPLSILTGGFGWFYVYPHAIESGFIHEALRASISIPLVFRPKKIAGKRCYDGNIAVDNVEDIIGYFHPRVVYSIELEETKFGFFSFCVTLFRFFFRQHPLVLSTQVENDLSGYTLHRIIVPSQRGIRIWGVEHFPFLFLVGEKAAKEYIVDLVKS